MNAINIIRQDMVMDGRVFQAKIDKPLSKVPQVTPIMRDSTEAVEKMAENLAEVKESVSVIRKVVEATMGTKLQFSVNEKLGRIVVSILDPNTNKIIREIPSKDVQKMQVRIRETIGLLFDEVV